MEILIVAVIIGLLVAVAWPFLARAASSRSPRDQAEVTDTSPIPPRHPDEPVPGSRTQREQRGRP